MKIVISVRDAIGTGGGTVALNTAKSLAKMGNSIKIISDYPVNVDGCTNEAMPLGERLYNWQPRLKFLRILRHFLQLFLFSIWGMLKLKKYEKKGYLSIDHNVESFGGDIIVLHNVFLFQFLSDSRSFYIKIKQLFNPIFFFRILREWLAVNFGRSQILISVSEASSLEVKAINKKNKRTCIIENGVDLEKFNLITDVEKKDLKVELSCEDKFVILFVGHEFVRKRLDLLIESLSLLDDNFVLWVIGGRAENIEKTQAMIEKFSVKERVFFLGSIQNPEKYMATADCFALLSDYETWGMVVVEALSAGTPCTMTNVGCASSIIENGLNGYIVPSNAESAANAIYNIRKNTHINYEDNARQSVKKFSWEIISEKYLNAVKEVKK